MTESSASPEAQRYLAALESALGVLPASTRLDILAGVREELVGLDAQHTAERIAQLGDPEFIAATALVEVEPDAPLTIDAAHPAQGEARWFSVVAALLLMVGSVVVPVIAPIVGLVLVWSSRAFTRAEKWIATLTPVGVATVVVLGSAVAHWATTATGTPGGRGSVTANTFDGFAAWHAAFLSVLVTPVVVGGWLLWRASRPRPVAAATPGAPSGHSPEPERAHTV